MPLHEQWWTTVLQWRAHVSSPSSTTFHRTPWTWLGWQVRCQLRPTAARHPTASSPGNVTWDLPPHSRKTLAGCKQVPGLSACDLPDVLNGQGVMKKRKCACVCVHMRTQLHAWLPTELTFMHIYYYMYTYVYKYIDDSCVNSISGFMMISNWTNDGLDVTHGTTHIEWHHWKDVMSSEASQMTFSQLLFLPLLAHHHALTFVQNPTTWTNTHTHTCTCTHIHA